MQYEELKLENLNNGAVNDLFNQELDRVLRNIHDLNVPANSMREIHIVVKIKPTEDRQSAMTMLQVYSVLPKNAAHGSHVALSFRDNKARALVSNERQMTMDDAKK